MALPDRRRTPETEGAMQYAKDFTDGLQFLWGEGFLSPGGPEAVANILSGTKLSGKRVLDIGSGLGGIDMLLAERFGASMVTGIDVEEQLVEMARDLASRRGLSRRVEFMTVDPGPLPFKDGSFELVFSKDAMVHVEDKLGIYREVKRVLAPGGEFRAGDWFWAKDAQNHPMVRAWLGAGPLHFAFTTPAQAEAALKAAGLRNVSVSDRRAELVASNRKTLARLEGPQFAELVRMVGEQSAAARREGTRLRQAVLEAGQLIPCHIKADRAA
jgi:phosphoethanolamine N-methyltransferase